MDNKPQTPSIELTKPQTETSLTSDSVETSIGSPESNLQPAQSVSQASDAVAQAIADSTVVSLPADDNQASAQVVRPVLADETDTIEKEVIEKAKEIVATTKSDPYAQSLGLSQLKSDLMKNRYGKEIKTPDENTK